MVYLIVYCLSRNGFELQKLLGVGQLALSFGVHNSLNQTLATAIGKADQYQCTYTYSTVARTDMATAGTNMATAENLECLSYTTQSVAWQHACR